MKKEKAFDITVSGKSYSLVPANCMVTLFREHGEMDNLAIDADEGMVRIFDNEDLCRWMAGLALRQTISGDFRYDPVEFNDKTFREQYGWNANTAILARPSEHIREEWMEVITQGMEQEWTDWTDAET